MAGVRAIQKEKTRRALIERRIQSVECRKKLF